MIIFPMAGLSKRFSRAGYELPKYMLEAHEESLFYHSVMSFRSYFTQQRFCFVALDRYETRSFIIDECRKMGLINYEIIVLEEPTRGQAETVYLALQRLNLLADEELLIFNIDTFRPGFSWPKEFDLTDVDGYLETFIGSGANWSNVLPKDELRQTVQLTAEKQQISEYCCTGLYFWKRSGDYCKIYENHAAQFADKATNGELYIAPMYNDMIQQGKKVRYSIVTRDEVVFCGIPEEYEEFRRQNCDLHE